MKRDSRRLRLILVLLLLTSFTLLTLDSRGGSSGGALGAVRSAAGAVLDPVQSAVRRVTAPIGRGVSAASDSGADRRQILALQQRNAQLQRDLSAERQAGDDVAALRQLGQFGYRGTFTFAFARVLTRGEAFGSAEQTVRLNVGSAAGVQPDMKVVAPSGGLVGRVVRVDRASCLVVLVTDRTFATAVQLASGSQSFSTVTGQGPGQPLALDFGDANRQLKKGDALYTVDASEGGVAVPGGLPVGTISAVRGNDGLRQSALVTPTADLSDLDQLGVAIGDSATPRRAVVPNSPAPTSPAPTTPAPTTPVGG